jgi:patatin-like phospholipase/acyl hydrolase
MTVLAEKLARAGRRKLLALDGGGIRGVMTLEVLRAIEHIVRDASGRPQLVLGDYFDYIGGTSTGAIIASCLACGMSVDEVLQFYVAQGPVMFQKASLLKRLYYEYEAEPLAQELRAKFGRDAAGNDRKLGDESLRCLLLLVLRNLK